MIGLVFEVAIFMIFIIIIMVVKILKSEHLLAVLVIAMDDPCFWHVEDSSTITQSLE